MISALRTRVKNVYTILLAYTRLEAVEDFSYPMTIVFDQLGKVFPVFLYYFVARLVEVNGGANNDVGGDYYTFSVIGLSVAVVLQAALGGFGSRLERAQSQGTFETMLVEPVPWTFVPIAMNVWRITISAVSCAAMLGFSALLGAQYRLPAVPAFVGLLALGALSCIGIGILSASLMVLAKRSQPILVLYGLAASLLGGALFPINVLPGWLQPFSYLVPHMYVINAARTVFMIEPPTDAMGVPQAVIILVVFNIVVLSVGMALFSRALQYARRLGTLSGY
ncbi:MAG: ABC transporter permease [Actinomycetota bacterium]|nr:ABC transporter permease [Actinomycetota bacterium]